MNPSTSTNPTHDTNDPFVARLEPILARVQRELRSIADRIPGTRSPTDLQRALGINYNTSWKVMRVIGAETPLKTGPFVPAHVSLKNLVAAAAKASIPVDASALLDASTEFHALVDACAGDRSTFDAMVSGLTGADHERVSSELKRNAFRLNRQIFGRGIDTALGANILRPADEPGCVDLMTLHCISGLVRLRANASLRIGTRRLRDRGTDVLAGREAVDPQALATYGAPFLLECMDGPIPPLKEVEGRDGSTETHLLTPSIGLDSEVSCVLADLRRSAPIGTDGDEPRFHYRIESRTPCRVMIQDLFVHETLFDGDLPDLAVLSAHPGSPAWPSPDSQDHLPFMEEISELPRRPDALHAPGVAAYGEIVGRAFRRLGWGELERYRVFRCLIEYPVLNSVVWQRLSLLPSGLLGRGDAG